MSGVKQFAPFKKIDTSIEPKVIGGLESNGMILAAGEKELKLPSIDSVDIGSIIS